MNTKKMSSYILPLGVLGLLLFLLTATVFHLACGEEAFLKTEPSGLMDGSLQKEWDAWFATLAFFYGSGRKLPPDGGGNSRRSRV